MIKIPLTAYPDQELQIELGEQMCTLHVFERYGFMYLDVTVKNTLIIAGMLCHPTTPALPPNLQGFEGNFYVIDTKAANTATQTEPNYTGWGTRYLLYWLSPAEMAQLEAARNG